MGKSEVHCPHKIVLKKYNSNENNNSRRSVTWSVVIGQQCSMPISLVSLGLVREDDWAGFRLGLKCG